MATTTVIKMVGTLILSFLIGLGTFYIVDAGEKKQKKKQIEEVTSMVIQFIIYVWLGKILVHIKIFFSDPIAVLAHPSDSKAFYIATLLTLLHLAYKARQRTIDVHRFMRAFIPILIYTSFMYEFLQIVTGQSIFHLYFILIMSLTAGYIALDKPNRQHTFPYYTLIVWLSGLLIISLGKGYITLFGYLLQPIYFIACLLLAVWSVWWGKRKTSVHKLKD